jgi:8-oxo-dGTP diphosphatase
MKLIRNSAKAIIIKNSKILLTKNQDEFGVFYLLPGGGQEVEENIHEALKRECMEEISSEISIKDILFVRDYIGKNHEFAEWDGEIHQIEYMFECDLISTNEPTSGCEPDNAQIGVEWVELKKIKEFRIYPSILKEVIHEDGSFEKTIYLGDTN